MESLPEELTDTIIDYLHDDIPSQQACSLVSKTFLALSRRHLFAQVRLKVWQRKWGRSLRKETLVSFLSIAPYIKSLIIDYDSELSSLANKGGQFNNLLAITTCQSSPTLTSLSSITHNWLNLCERDQRRPSAFLPKLLGSTMNSQLTELDFGHCRLPLHVIAHAAASCTNLKKLSLRDGRWESLAYSAPDPPLLPYRLREFSYRGYHHFPWNLLFQWIFSHEQLPVVCALDFLVSLQDESGIASLIADWGASVKSLKLDFHWNDHAIGMHYILCLTGSSIPHLSTFLPAQLPPLYSRVTIVTCCPPAQHAYQFR
jgi:hypothetical protein